MDRSPNSLTKKLQMELDMLREKRKEDDMIWNSIESKIMRSTTDLLNRIVVTAENSNELLESLKKQVDNLSLRFDAFEENHNKFGKENTMTDTLCSTNKGKAIENLESDSSKLMSSEAAVAHEKEEKFGKENTMTDSLCFTNKGKAIENLEPDSSKLMSSEAAVAHEKRGEVWERKYDD